jgi:hydroxymethylbilane synthase
VLYLSSRQSPLAQVQAKEVVQKLEALGVPSEIKTFITSGDAFLKDRLIEAPESPTSPLVQKGKGLFVKEIQEALFEDKAQLAVHSLKDVPIEPTPGLSILGFLPRASKEDLLILSPSVCEALKKEWSLDYIDLPFEVLKESLKIHLASKTIGTASLRRQSLIKALLGSSITCEVLRGNVNTRLRRLQNEEFGAIILAKAGMERLGLLEGLKEQALVLPPDFFIPAPGQGAIALEVRSNELKGPYKDAIKTLCDKEGLIAITLERLALYCFGGGCETAFGAYFTKKTLKMFFESLDQIFIVSYELSSEELEEVERLALLSEYTYSEFFEALKKTSLKEKIQNLIRSYIS